MAARDSRQIGPLELDTLYEPNPAMICAYGSTEYIPLRVLLYFRSSA